LEAPIITLTHVSKNRAITGKLQYTRTNFITLWRGYPHCTNLTDNKSSSW